MKHILGCQDCIKLVMAIDVDGVLSAEEKALADNMLTNDYNDPEYLSVVKEK